MYLSIPRAIGSQRIQFAFFAGELAASKVRHGETGSGRI
jgi:hypothetical protein